MTQLSLDSEQVLHLFIAMYIMSYIAKLTACCSSHILSGLIGNLILIRMMIFCFSMKGNIVPCIISLLSSSTYRAAYLEMTFQLFLSRPECNGGLGHNTLAAMNQLFMVLLRPSLPSYKYAIALFLVSCVIFCKYLAKLFVRRKFWMQLIVPYHPW